MARDLHPAPGHPAPGHPAPGHPAPGGADGAPRWLDDHEQAAWRSFVQMQQQLMARLNRGLTLSSSMSDGDYGILVSLSEAPDQRLRAFELARTMQWEKSRLSHQLTRMEKRGMVRREECPSDARGAFVAITPDGRSAIEAAAPRHVEDVRTCFVDLLTSDQLEVLRTIAETVLANLAATDGPCPSEACPTPEHPLPVQSIAGTPRAEPGAAVVRARRSTVPIMEIRGIVFAGTATDHRAEMADFAQQVLGLRRAVDTDPSADMFELSDGTRFAVADAREDHPGTSRTIGFLVGDVDAAARELRSAGVSVDEPQQNERHRYVHFIAPDGELYELVAERRWDSRPPAP